MKLLKWFVPVQNCSSTWVTFFKGFFLIYCMFFTTDLCCLLLMKRQDLETVVSEIMRLMERSAFSFRSKRVKRSNYHW